MFRARLQEVTLTCFVLQVLLLGLSSAQFNKQVGDSCKLHSGGTGVCKDFNDCDLDLLSKEPPQPAICAWGEDAIVCCPSPNNQPNGVYEVVTTYNKKTQPNVPRNLQSSSSGGGGRSKNSQKCDEYRKTKTDISQTIVGGDNVESVSHYPHIALLGYGNPPKWLCGGTLISEQFIVTAAHCLNADHFPVTTANLGFIDKRNRNEFGTLQEFRIVQTYKHPSRKAPKQYADIALLKLDRPVQFSKGVIPACLYEEFDFPVKSAQAIGWGDLTTSANAGSDILQKVHLPLTSFEDCSSKYPAHRRLPQGVQTETQFCAGDYMKDTCQGDSGGPLQFHDASGMARLIGITSTGILCGVQPGIYTRVSHYVPWIESIIWP